MKITISLALLASLGLSVAAQAADFSSADICKAAISVEMGQPTKTMKTKSAGSTPEISYRRPDGDAFRYRCEVSEDRVYGQRSWMTPENGEGGEPDTPKVTRQQRIPFRMACLRSAMIRQAIKPSRRRIFEALNRRAHLSEMSAIDHPNSTSFCIDSLLLSHATPKACEVRGRGLPVLIPYIALSGNRSPAFPKAVLATVKSDARKSPVHRRGFCENKLLSLNAAQFRVCKRHRSWRRKLPVFTWTDICPVGNGVSDYRSTFVVKLKFHEDIRQRPVSVVVGDPFYYRIARASLRNLEARNGYPILSYRES